MGKLDQLRSSLFLLVKRDYYLDKWIGDASLLSILQNQYNLHDISKYYVNRYIINIGLNQVNIFQHQEDYLFGKQHNVRKTFFYIFSTTNSCPDKLSREGFIDSLSSFRHLRSDKLTTTTTNKRKALSEINSTMKNIVSLEAKKKLLKSEIILLQVLQKNIWLL